MSDTDNGSYNAQIKFYRKGQVRDGLRDEKESVHHLLL